MHCRRKSITHLKAHHARLLPSHQEKVNKNGALHYWQLLMPHGFITTGVTSNNEDQNDNILIFGAHYNLRTDGDTWPPVRDHNNHSLTRRTFSDHKMVYCKVFCLGMSTNPKKDQLETFSLRVQKNLLDPLSKSLLLLSVTSGWSRNIHGLRCEFLKMPLPDSMSARCNFAEGCSFRR